MRPADLTTELQPPAVPPVARPVFPPAPSEVGRYRRDGFLVVEDLLSDLELASLRAESVRICRPELAAAEARRK